MFILADKLIITIYGTDFESSIMPLRILISGLLVVFLNFPVGALLNASNRQSKKYYKYGDYSGCKSYSEYIFNRLQGNDL